MVKEGKELKEKLKKAKEKLNTLSKKRILLVILLFIISFMITKEIRQQFPEITISSRSMEYLNQTMTVIVQEEKIPFIKYTGQSELQRYCSAKYENSILTVEKFDLDEWYVKEGDMIALKKIVTTDVVRLDYLEFYSGLNKENLQKIDKGTNDLGLIYYSKKDIPVYLLVCFNQTAFSQSIINPKRTILVETVLSRPSFIDSEIGSILIFLTTFILLGSFSITVYKLLFTIQSQQKSI